MQVCTRRPHLTNVAQIWPESIAEIDASVIESLKADCLYADSVAQHRDEIEAMRRDEHLVLPENIDYRSIPQLSSEEVEKLNKYRPMTLGAASRIDGVTPASLLVLHTRCRKPKEKNTSARPEPLFEEM